jgi:hypothetical protein
MQSDAFPTPSIYFHQFQPVLAPLHLSNQQDSNLDDLLKEIELLTTECSSKELNSFWAETDRIDHKYQKRKYQTSDDFLSCNQPLN